MLRRTPEIGSKAPRSDRPGTQPFNINQRVQDMARIQMVDPIAEASLDDIFRFLRPVRTERSAARQTQSFRLDVSEDDKSYVVAADLPGVAKDDIQVTLDANQVTIAAEHERNTEAKEGERVLLAERRTGTFFRSFQLPVEIDESVSEATFQNGVLTLRLAKKAPQTGRRLTIQ